MRSAGVKATLLVGLKRVMPGYPFPSRFKCTRAPETKSCLGRIKQLELTIYKGFVLLVLVKEGKGCRNDKELPG